MAAAKGNKNAVGNRGGGVTEYKREYAGQAYKLCLLGYTDKDLATFFEVSEQTINEWKKSKTEFLESLKKGKDIADAKIVIKLFKRANGYKYDEVSFEKLALDGDDKENIKKDVYKKKVVTKEVAPDVTAQIFWLKNRQKDKWRDRHYNSIDLDLENLSDHDLDKVVKMVLSKSGK
jgi:transcriptional regulator with XRE-family HTH domain